VKVSIGIIGNGYVGGSLVNGFKDFFETKIFDNDVKRSLDSFDTVINTTDFIFVCVPTPMSIQNGGRVDPSIVEDVLAKISTNLNKGNNPLIIIKSSLPPGAVEKLIVKFSNLDIVFNPEFLTEKNADKDFINATRVLIGGEKHLCEKLAALYRKRFKDKKIIQTDVTTAQYVKYMCNCFFSVKVSFMNEMFQAAQALGVNWKDACEGFVSDGRVGLSHLDVPGHDGFYGFGGKCFPKDINAFINVLTDNGVDPVMLRAAWEKNLQVREQHDWEDIPGAVSELEANYELPIEQNI
jgi:nucleotide sugar dehydrogenase